MYESMLHSSLGHERTNGTCLYAAILCEALLRNFAALDPIIRGGDGKEDGAWLLMGFRTATTGLKSNIREESTS